MKLLATIPPPTSIAIPTMMPRITPIPVFTVFSLSGMVYAYFNYNSHTGSHLAGCQHPGSPGCPQQFCLFLIFIKLLRNRRYSFLWSGIGADILVKNDLRLDIFSSVLLVSSEMSLTSWIYYKDGSNPSRTKPLMQELQVCLPSFPPEGLECQPDSFFNFQV